jgi:hypothetical protein
METRRRAARRARRLKIIAGLSHGAIESVASGVFSACGALIEGAKDLEEI